MLGERVNHMAKKISKAAVAAKTAKTQTKSETKATNKGRKARVVSFTVVTVNKRRNFTPVNKRAKAFADIAGVTKLSTKHLKAIKALGFKVVETGSLNPISL
jgi:hypothetical protein